ncbi:MAG: relaxase/mobilization nuclease domain-containing protein [Lachnospiraceae bacterium]|jgi:hypothetical protein
MATSKLKVIKKTLKKAIDYIINPEKTEGGTLVYSHGCSVETADREMELTARQGTGRGDRIAYHLMQAFSPDDDITPEKALELGIEFARSVTGGKYEFVVSTHVDKDHIHNHIIFNAVDYVSHRKYHSDKKDKYRIRDINDEICKANNLSVLPKYDAKRKTKHRNVHKEEKVTWQKKLRYAIDDAIRNSDTFDDLLYALEMEGYEIKKGKHIKFRAPGQERFTRAKTIGENYTEEEIRKRIANKEKEAEASFEEPEILEKKQAAPEVKERVLPKKKIIPSKRINLLVDVSKNIKAQQSKAYEHALIRSNINTMVKTMNFLISHKITTSEDFQIYADAKNAELSLYRKDLRNIESELMELSEKIKFTQNYKKNAHVYYEAKRAKDPAAYAREHEDQLVLFHASEIYFKKKQLKPKEVNLAELFERYRQLSAEKAELSKKSNSLKQEIKELEVVAENIEKAIGEDITGREEGRKNSERGKEREK